MGKDDVDSDDDHIDEFPSTVSYFCHYKMTFLLKLTDQT